MIKLENKHFFLTCRSMPPSPPSPCLFIRSKQPQCIELEIGIIFEGPKQILLGRIGDFLLHPSRTERVSPAQTVTARALAWWRASVNVAKWNETTYTPWTPPSRPLTWWHELWLSSRAISCMHINTTFNRCTEYESMSSHVGNKTAQEKESEKVEISLKEKSLKVECC